MKNIKNIFGFTLVELIVVITIVGILSTVGFVSYSGYLSGARDSNRFSQLTKLSDSLQVYAATKSLPLPDDYIEIIASGSVVAYQGYVGVDVLETIDYTNGGKDPKDGTYYTYYVTKNRKNMQLLAFMEEESSVTLNTQTFAADYTERVPKVYGKKLGVLTEVTTNTPAQEVSGVTVVDILSNTIIFNAHISDNEKVTGTGVSLISGTMSLIAGKNNTSCREILSYFPLTQGMSGKYVITLGEDTVKVYCDMETDGGGWTRVEYASDLVHQGQFSTSDAGRYLDNNFTFILRDEQINILRSLSTEGKQRYHGTCKGVLHYGNGGGNYVHAFGFRFQDGSETSHGQASYSSSNITVSNDGCSVNDAALRSTDFDIYDTRVPILNVYSSDNASNEFFGSPLTENPAWFR